MKKGNIGVVIYGQKDIPKTVLDDLKEIKLNCVIGYLDSLDWTNKQIVGFLEELLEQEKPAEEPV